MKNYLSVFGLVGMFLIAGCSEGVDEEVTLYASIGDHEESKAILLSLSTEVDELQDQLLTNNEKIGRALDLLKVQKQLTANVDINSSFIEGIKDIDFKSVDGLSDRVGLIEAKNKATQIKRKKKQLAKMARVKKEKAKLNVFVSRINNWGGSLVAIINIPGRGFETLSVYSSVGNDWSISKIERNSVSFVHASGKTSRVFL